MADKTTGWGLAHDSTPYQTRPLSSFFGLELADGEPPLTTHPPLEDSVHSRTQQRAVNRGSFSVSRSARTPLVQSRTPPALALAAAGGALAGLCLGFALAHMTPAPPGAMAALLAGACGLALAVAAVLVLRHVGHRGDSRLEDDASAAAGTRVALEQALAARDCAIAHSVRTIARAGVIEHLVATPVRVWVIATVNRRVTREELPAVLAQVADNTTAVWDWAPPGTPVRGCLVIGGGAHPARNRYDYGKGPVVVHTPDSLACELKAEAKLSRELDERVADALWNLRPRPGWRAGPTSPRRAPRQSGMPIRSPSSPATHRHPPQEKLNRTLSRAR